MIHWNKQAPSSQHIIISGTNDASESTKIKLIFFINHISINLHEGFIQKIRLTTIKIKEKTKINTKKKVSGTVP